MWVLRAAPWLIKAIQGALFDRPRSHLMPVKRTVTRGGQSFVQTFYVDPSRDSDPAPRQTAADLLRERGQLGRPSSAAQPSLEEVSSPPPPSREVRVLPGHQATYNHLKQLELAEVVAPAQPSAIIKLMVIGRPHYAPGRRIDAKPSDPHWSVVLRLPSGQEVQVSDSVTRREALAKARTAMANPDAWLGRLGSILRDRHPKDYETLARAGLLPQTPAPPPRPEPSAPTPAPTYVDVGEKIGGARKDLAALKTRLDQGTRVQLSDLSTLEQDPALARRYVTRDGVLGKATEIARELEQAGKSPGAAYLYTKMVGRIDPQPRDTPQARAQFAAGLDRVREAFAQVSTLKEALGAMRDLAMEYTGVYIPAELREPHAALRARYAERSRAQREFYATKVTPLTNAMGAAERKMQTQRKGRGAQEQVPEYEAIRADWEQHLQQLHKLEEAEKQALEELRAFEAPLRQQQEQDPLSRKNILAALGTDFLTYIGATYNQSARNTLDKHQAEAQQFEQQMNWSWLEPSARARGRAKSKPVWERVVPETLERQGPAVPLLDSNQLMQTFGLRAVEYGNWMDYESSKAHTQAAGEALYDFAQVLGIPIRQISLNGRLALAFGARGKGMAGGLHAVAHYESARKVINLTKFAGGGSVAHEWAHFLDNILAMLSYGPQGGENSFCSEGEVNWNGLPPGLRTAFEAVQQAILEGDYRPERAVEPPKKPLSYYYPDLKKQFQNGTDHAALQEKLQAEYLRRVEYEGAADEPKIRREVLRRAQYVARLSGQPVRLRLGPPTSHFYATAQSQSPYAARKPELFARAFEAYISDQLEQRGMKNTYLVSGASEAEAERMARTYAPLYAPEFDGVYSVYPRGQERQRINAAMGQFVEALKTYQMLVKAARAWPARFV